MINKQQQQIKLSEPSWKMINQQHQQIKLSRPGEHFGFYPKDIAERDMASRFVKQVFRTVCARINSYGDNPSHPSGGSITMHCQLLEQGLRIKNQAYDTKYQQLNMAIKQMEKSANRNTICIIDGIGDCQDIATILFKALTEAQLAQKYLPEQIATSQLEFGYIYAKYNGDHVFNYAKASNGDIYLIDCWAQKLVLVDRRHPDYLSINCIIKGIRVNCNNYDSVTLSKLMNYGVSNYTNKETEYARLKSASHHQYHGDDWFAYYAARISVVTTLYRNGKLSQEKITIINKTLQYLDLTKLSHGLNDSRQMAKLNKLTNLASIIQHNSVLQQKLVDNTISSSKARTLLLHYRQLFKDSGVSHPNRYIGIKEVLMLTEQMIEAKEEEEQANSNDEQNRPQQSVLDLLNGVTRKL